MFSDVCLVGCEGQPLDWLYVGSGLNDYSNRGHAYTYMLNERY